MERSRKRSYSESSSGSITSRYSSHSKKPSETSEVGQLAEMERSRRNEQEQKFSHEATVNELRTLVTENSKLLSEVEEKREDFQCGTRERALSEGLTSAEHVTSNELLNQGSDDAEDILQPFNAKVFEKSNLKRVVDFIFSIDEDVMSKICAWKIIEAFDDLFDKYQSGLVCITRPPCWGKTTMINILMLHYSVSFYTNQNPVELRIMKTPLDVFCGRQALQYERRSIMFAKGELSSITHVNSTPRLCFSLDFSSIKGNTYSDLADDFQYAVHQTLEYYYHFLSNHPKFQDCIQRVCNEMDHLDVLVNALDILSRLKIFEDSPRILFIDEVDYPLIRVRHPMDSQKLRRALESFIRKVRGLTFKVITFGVFPNICDEIMPNNMANMCSVTNPILKNAFGINKEEGLRSELILPASIESANGFTYNGTNEVSIFCYFLWKNNEVEYPKDYMKYKSFLLIENRLKESGNFVDLTSDLLKYKFKFLKETERSLVQNNLNLLMYAGFLVTMHKKTLPEDLKEKVASYFEVEENIPEDGRYYVFPNTIMQNSLQMFLGNVLRSKMIAEHGENYLFDAEEEFTRKKLTHIIERICNIFRCSEISCEKDYEKQLTNYLAPVLMHSYFVINQVPSGKGILDIILLPRVKDYPAYILEAKFKSEGTEIELDESCLKAFHQIWIMKYHDKFVDADIVFIGVAVSTRSISCSIASKVVFAECNCEKPNKDIPCQVVREAPRMKKFRQV